MIEGNYVGLDAGRDGRARQTRPYGIEVFGGGLTGNNTIGGSSVIGGAAGPRNVISGNAEAGSPSRAAPAQTIQGNYIGTNAAGRRGDPGLTVIVARASASRSTRRRRSAARTPARGT